MAVVRPAGNRTLAAGAHVEETTAASSARGYNSSATAGPGPREPRPPPAERMADPQPTLLVFTRGPDRERARRRLLGAGAGELELALYSACLAEALTAAAGAGCRAVVCAPAAAELVPGVARLPQEGAGFGERLATALAAATMTSPPADEGAEAPLLVVGTDTPGISLALLRRALDLLAASPRRVVLGPSPDGGVYLLAARVPLAPLVGRVRWCGHGTRASLTRELAAAGLEPVLLPPLADLDRRADLEAWLAARGVDPRFAALRRQLRAALALHRRPLAGSAMPSAAAVPRGLPARAPPC